MHDNSWFGNCAETLIDPDNLRVWSVIVSLFGDLARAPGDRLSGTALLRIISPMGIKPEAIRVALHRLRKDGWLESERIGRASAHSLTISGRAQSDEVSPRIYARQQPPSKDWHLLIANEAGDRGAFDDLLLTENHIALARNVALASAPPQEECEDLLVLPLPPAQVPGWVRDHVCPEDLRATTRNLSDALEHVGLPPDDAKLSDLQIATLRTLLIHRWRRIALRYPDLPAEFFPGDWSGPQCRDRVFQLLDRLPQPSLAAIEAEAAA